VAPRSPEVGPDRRVTFRLLAPKAGEVTLTGEFMDGSRSLQKDDKGVWSVTVGPLEPEIYNYNFIIDGVRTIDPNNPDVKTGSTALPSRVFWRCAPTARHSTTAKPRPTARSARTGMSPSR
jgi:1,4-alpha-glucan branching enzyme